MAGAPRCVVVVVRVQDCGRPWRNQPPRRHARDMEAQFRSREQQAEDEQERVEEERAAVIAARLWSL